MRKESGQTIMELLIAMTVIVVGLFSAMTLVYSNVALVDRDTDEVTSVNLAREGVELAKQLRDSNWLSGSSFDAGMENGADYTATPVWDGVVVAPSFSFVADDVANPDAQIIQISVTGTAGFLANANLAGAITGTPTVFKRLITFHPICADQTVLDSGAVCVGAKIGVRTESRLEWVRKGITKSLTIYSDLYDWK